MKNKKPTVSIGISAYNEEENTKILLKKIIEQKVEGADLNKVIFVSDGSTDKTVAFCKSIKFSGLKIIDHKQRLGKMVRMNEILKLSDADILILLDADVLPTGSNFVQEVIKPILEDEKVGLVGANTESITGDTFIGRVIAVSHNFKKDAYKEIKNGNNIYLCHGRARAFSKRLYSKLEWPNHFPEDAYSYLTCLSKGFKFVYAPKAKILFRSPATLSDHFKQSIRFIKGKEKMYAYFPKDYVRKEYYIPRILLVRKFIKYLFISPINILAYSMVSFYTRIIETSYKISENKWDISKTTKRVIYEDV